MPSNGARHAADGGEQSVAEGVAYNVGLVCQPAAATLPDKKQSAAVIRGEQRKAQPPIEREQTLILITGGNGYQHALDNNDPYS